METQIIKLGTPSKIIGEDYAQSANSLFHFMQAPDFLHTALSKCALIPRYCREDISYLDIKTDNGEFNEVAIPQKCFCDIPLHNIAPKFKKDIDTDKLDIPLSLYHTDFYGRYAIALSKQWGEKNNLQPIQYVNTKSDYCEGLKDYFLHTLDREELPEEYVDVFLYRLAFIKPLRGNMKRYTKDHELVVTQKNFHDEQEWRYIPSLKDIKQLNEKNRYQIMPIIANPLMVKMKLGDQDFVNGQSKALEKDIYNNLWLKFKYDDIKYIIVPNKQARIDCISFVLKLPDEQFNNMDNAQLEKSILISKILVLDELRKDW